MARKYIFGNWKMHGLGQAANVLALEIAAQPLKDGVEVALFPPFTMLGFVAQVLREKASRIALGAQDVSPEKEGAFTGDISAAMLKDAGCQYVIVGHSERRAGHGESDELVRRKAIAAQEAGLTPVICVGETLSVREAGKHAEVITAQVKKSIPDSGAYIIAYEPVWAIGTGKTPTTTQIAEAHKLIASLLSSGTSGARTAILYGGSVKSANAREILAAEAVDGVLVGGASLNPGEFCQIIAAGC